MSCCGQKREGVSVQASRPANFAAYPGAQPSVVLAAPTRATGTAFAPPDRNRTVTLQYRSRSAVIVSGSTTGKRYQFSVGGSMQAVDKRDAEALIASGLFERIGG